MLSIIYEAILTYFLLFSEQGSLVIFSTYLLPLALNKTCFTQPQNVLLNHH